MISTFFDVVAGVLAFFYGLVPSYGFAVAGLTLTVMVVVTPLTLKSTRSMLELQRLQPELKAIQNRHKGSGDRQAMNEEMMEFYKGHGISPLGGCLPLLVQLPVFLVLFRVVQGITRRVSGVGSQLGWTSGRIGSGGPRDVSPLAGHERPFDPSNLSADSEMYRDLTGEGLPFDERPTEMVSIGMDLSRSMQNVLSDGFVATFPYLVLIVIVLISSLYQQRQIRGRNKGVPINPQQEMIMKIIPYMLPVFSFTMPAALVVYFVISNVYRIGQQGYITHSLYKGDESLGAQAARSRDKARDAAEGGDQPAGKGITPKKGQPTPRRDGAKPRAKAPAPRRSRSARSSARSGAAANSKGRAKPGGSGSTRNKTQGAGSSSKGSAGSKSADKAGAKSGAKSGSKSAGKPAGDSAGPTGAGRTGNAPSRFHSASGAAGSRAGKPKSKQKKRR